MARQFSTAVRSARAQALETAYGTTPILRIYTGSQPATPATAASGTLLLEINLPSDWVTESNGVLTKSGTWSSTGLAAGTAAHYRIYGSNGTTCHEQGSVTATGGGGDMTMDNTSIAVDQVAAVGTWSSTEGGA